MYVVMDGELPCLAQPRYPKEVQYFLNLTETELEKLKALTQHFSEPGPLFVRR